MKNFATLPRDFSCNILVKNVADFCPYLQEAKMKVFESIPQAEEISKQPRIDSVVWSLVLTLRKIYNEKRQ